MTKLDEIEARLKAAMPNPNAVVTTSGDVTVYWLYQGEPIDQKVIPQAEMRANVELITRAPADLALLLRLVRMVADGDPCDAVLFLGFGQRCSRIDPCCLPCRIRKELEGYDHR